MSLRLLFTLLALAIFCVSPAAATVVVCPSGSLTNTFAPISLGASAATCGSVTNNSGTVTASTGAADTTAGALSTWLGVTLTSSGITAVEGSAFGFFGVHLNTGDTIDFDWAANFENGSTGFVFLEAASTVFELAHNLGGAAATPSGHFTLYAGGPLTTDVAFGAVSGCAPCITPLTLLDPSLSISNITYQTAVPEPASAVLIGCGLAAVALIRRRSRA